METSPHAEVDSNAVSDMMKSALLALSEADRILRLIPGTTEDELAQMEQSDGFDEMVLALHVTQLREIQLRKLQKQRELDQQEPMEAQAAGMHTAYLIIYTVQGLLQD